VIPLIGIESQPLVKAQLDQAAYDPEGVCAFTSTDEAEVLRFLASRPLHTVYMAGLIRDNGLVSSRNRGTFQGYRDNTGQLEGVALIGHVTQVEVCTARALKAFAIAAQECHTVHVVMGERAVVHDFWRYYSSGGQALRVACRELLLELKAPIVTETVSGLRLAVAADLPLIMRVQAALAVAECGVDPLVVDPEGFQARCARRVARGRIWVLVEDGKLLFKADIMADTPESIYLEGVYVNARYRRHHYGKRCLLTLGRILLRHTNSVCLLVNERNVAAQSFYYSVGYKLRGLYDTIYLYQESQLRPDD
jgi:ribosomal protein S18 acetylase RimI-like enzyme